MSSVLLSVPHELPGAKYRNGTLWPICQACGNYKQEWLRSLLAAAEFNDVPMALLRNLGS